MRSRTRAQVREALPDRVNIDVERFRAELGDRLDRFARGVASEMANEVQVGGVISPGTPVDTGFARASWDAAIGQEPAGTVAGSAENPDPAAAQTRIAEVIAQWGADQPVLRIANSASYAIDLEAGHSQQAPNGMVGLAIAGAQQIAEDVAALLRQEVPA